MNEAIKEDQEGEYSGLFGQRGGPGRIDEEGNLGSTLIDDLREFKQDELMRLEEAILNARQPTEDLFGIKRRFCKVCQQGCNGYLPNNTMVPQPGEFPTFCKHCKCPAHFHSVCESPADIKFPEDLKECLHSYNIEAKDLNFNCVVLSFQVRDVSQRAQNMAELFAILKDEGLEVVSIETRHLEVEEAIYLKSRIVTQTESRIHRALGLGVKNSATNGIRDEGQHGSAFVGKSGAHDPFMLNKNAD